MALQSENVLELKERIHRRIKEEGIDSQVRELIRGLRENKIVSEGPIEEQVLRNLKDTGVLKNLLSGLHLGDSIRFQNKIEGQDYGHTEAKQIQPDIHDIPVSKDSVLLGKVNGKGLNVSASSKSKEELNSERRYLHVKLLSGRAFLDYLLEETPPSKKPCSMLIMQLHFRGQRFRTKPTLCTCDPEFNESFFLELHNNMSNSNSMADVGELLGISDQIHIVLMKILPDGDKQILSSVFIEWRHVLASSNFTRTKFVELNGVCTESNITIGIIEIQFTLFPKLSHIISEKVVNAQVKLEKNMQTDRERAFLVYAKKWWQEYILMRPVHSKRAVKIFCQDENYKTRPVFQFVNVLYVGRPLLETPRESAWFVALMPCADMKMVGTAPNSDLWYQPHTFLCIKKGGLANHAVLLCSLLLGFGLDAYVCIGTRNDNRPWLWVVTMGESEYVTFWESTTGGRYLHRNFHNVLSQEELEPPYPYKTVGCLFNNKYLYATIQPTDEVFYSSFAVNDSLCWKMMSDTPSQSVSEGQFHTFPVPLVPGWSDPVKMSLNLEQELQILITENRKDLNLSTQWDPQLSHLIAPILSSYETEHRTGVSAGIEEFVEVIHKNIPIGFGFRALPLQLTSLEPRQVLRACLCNSTMQEIISSAETDLKLGMRVYTYVYPEDVLSVWLILACKYRTA